MIFLTLNSKNMTPSYFRIFCATKPMISFYTLHFFNHLIFFDWIFFAWLKLPLFFFFLITRTKLCLIEYKICYVSSFGFEKVNLCRMLKKQTFEQLMNPIYVISHLNGVFHNYAFWIIDYHASIFLHINGIFNLYVGHTKQTQFLWVCYSHHCNLFLSLVSLVMCLPLPHPSRHLLGMVSRALCFLLCHPTPSFCHMGMSQSLPHPFRY